jgi:L-lactate dehydrogenase complex protein LldE
VKIALFITCINDTMFPDTGKALVRLLTRLGHEVEFPVGQTCCGQMHFNTGYREQCAPMVRGFTDAFESCDVVVTPSASCAAMVRDWHGKIAADTGDAGLVEASARVRPKVYELSELLVDVLGVTDVGAYYPHRVTYHPTCHSLRLLKVGDRPLQLLRAVRGIDLVELPDAAECCGFGGTFALKNPDVSAAMAADKVGRIAETGADTLCAADNSCLMHIGGTLSRLHSDVRTLHLAEILAGTDD